MNRVDRWFLQTPRRRLVLWLGFMLPLSIAGFLAGLSDRDTFRAELAIVVGPVMTVVSLVQARRAYRDGRR